MKFSAIGAIVFGLAAALATPSLAGSQRRNAAKHRQQHYVPAGGDLIEWLFGGPRYYDKRLVTTAAEPCAYQRTGPDANAANAINDHYCGK